MPNQEPVTITENFHPHPIFMLPGTGLILLENGDIQLQIQAIRGAEVTASIGNDPHSAVVIPLQDPDDDGIYEAVYHPDDSLTGPLKLVFRVNGNITLNPYAPLWFHANSLSNYIEFPDEETDALIAARKEIPHGTVSHEFYYSEVYGKFVNSLIYTPPGYHDGAAYPVLYLFHEVAENATAWTDATRLNFLMDNLIADGKCQPFIIVENDCTTRLDYHERPDWFEGYPQLERFLIDDCIKYIEAKYHTRTGKWDRAIAGFGLGAVQAGYIGMRNTQVFGNIGLFTAFWVSEAFHDQGKYDPFYEAAEYIGKNPDEIKVFYRSEGDQDVHFKGVISENALLARLGIDQLPGYVFKTYHASHGWGSYRRSLRDFAPLLFQNIQE